MNICRKSYKVNIILRLPAEALKPPCYAGKFNLTYGDLFTLDFGTALKHLIEKESNISW